jgi:environmental stress-induced protein Ves
MKISASILNKFLFFKLPSAFICGVSVKEMDENKCIATVKHRWINQNPFHSMYFAVQAMAAELTTGALVMLEIQKRGENISMLVANTKGNYSKKATGRITFVCNDGSLVSQAVQKAIATREGQTFWMKSTGTNEKGEQVSEMDFEWSVRIKTVE